MLRHSGGASQVAWLGGNKQVEVRMDHRSLENWATEELKTGGGPSPRQVLWHELFPKFDLHVVYTPGPVNPLGDLLSRWAYPANPALGDVSIHGTAQASGDVRDMMAAEKEELQCETCPSCAIHTHDTERKQGYMTPMPIPMEPMDSIALDMFHHPSTSHDGEVYDQMLLCVFRLSGYLIAIPIPKPRHEDKDEGLTGKRTTHLVMERWVDRFGAPREICSDRGPQFVSQFLQTLCSKIAARSTMCLAARHQGNGKAENTGKQLRRAVAKALTLKKGTNWLMVLPAVV